MGKRAGSLVVDDEPDMRRTLVDILQDEGYDVDAAGNGTDAVAMCAEQSYDVVLMDVRMPGLNGVEAFRKIRRHQEGVRVILMSAYVMEDLKRQALEEGVIAYLEKPLNVEKVILLIEEAAETAILVVADDDATVDTLCSTLKDNRFHVTVASSPHEALELAEQIRFDIIFIDVELPTMTGLDFYLAIKELTPSAVAVMISGAEEEFERIAREAVRRTAYAILHKPLDLDHLLNMLRRIHSQKLSDAIQKPDVHE